MVLCHAGQFVQRGGACGHFAQAVFKQVQHATLCGQGVQAVGIASFDDGAAQGLIQYQQFVDACASTVAGVAAVLSTYSAVNGLARCAKAPQAGTGQQLGVGHVAFLAVRAQRTHQALRQHAVD